MELFNSNGNMALEICEQLFSTDEGLARRLLHETIDGIDLILEDFEMHIL